ncbi:hypothetical protein AEYBE204_10385 [Asticcacaulis sp. YBE204]|nr:hypothetical protein AEYBE204_10385 [Asticcacaulis sp. YBE204]
MLVDISNRLARLVAVNDVLGLQTDEECRRALGFILLERLKQGQGVGHCGGVAKFALFPARYQREVALMTVTWPRADWGSPSAWSERFYD